METLYDILEVSKKASKEIIEKAYRTLAKKYHPDLQTAENRKYAEEMMKKINEAYDILSDDEKRIEYDKKLEEKKQQQGHNNMNNLYYTSYSNSSQNSMYNRQQNVNTETNVNKENDWKSQFANLSPREQKKVINKIQKDANAEYRKQYENYFRSLGFRIKHKWTFKDFVRIGILVLVLIFIFFILWLIPSTHEWLVQLYEGNFLVRIVVDIIRGLFQGLIKFFQNIPKF